MNPRFFLGWHKNSSQSKHAHDCGFPFKQLEDLHKAKWLCMCFNYSSNKTWCFFLSRNLDCNIAVGYGTYLKKSFNTGWQEMFWTIGTIGLITYAKVPVPQYMCINWTDDVGGRLQPHVTNSVDVEESGERDTEKKWQGGWREQERPRPSI